MSTSEITSEKGELLTEGITRIIDLFNALRTEIGHCVGQYYASPDRQTEFNLDYWYDRFLLPGNLCADIVTFSNGLLTEMLNPWDDYQRSFSGTEHIFTVKPTSNEIFIQRIQYMKSLLIPLALLFLHSAINPENQARSDTLVKNITSMVSLIIKIRGEDTAKENREVIAKWWAYFTDIK